MALPIAFLEQVQTLLGPKGWTTDPDRLEQAATPWRGTYKGETPLIVMPKTTSETSKLVHLCSEHNVAITPQGGNTGLVDAGTPHGEVTLSLCRMHGLRDIDSFNNSITIEAGATLRTVQDLATDADRFFPLSLGSEGTATIGGLISTNAGGVSVLRYGMMRDLLLGLEVVLPDGEVWHGLSGLRKNNTGYDLKHLFAGAEGTLGIVTAATLKLFPKTAKSTAWITCKAAGDIVKLLALVREHAGDTVTSFEMIPANALEMVRKEHPQIRDPNPSQHSWRVLCEISMPKENQARSVLETALAAAIECGLAEDAVIAETLEQTQRFWTIRETIPLSKRAYGTAINHDISVPVSRIPDFLDAADKQLKRNYPDAEIIAFGHVGDGNLHFSACEPANSITPKLAANAAEITHLVHQLTTEFGGSISAEHGVGRLKRDELIDIRSPAATAAMRGIKSALDPKNIMNPGRVVPRD
ncbi:MAG: FAD-binding oxidoreductase [Henriciella sp.]